MNDNAIIRIISNIHFAIVSLFLFIFLSGSVLFVSLLNGIYIDRLILPGIQIDALYINWNEKLRLSASNIRIKKQKSAEQKPFDPKNLKKAIKVLTLYNNWFETVDVTSLTYNDLHLSFEYLADDKSHLHAVSPYIEIDSDFLFGPDATLITINYLNALEQNSSLSGNIVFDPSDIALYVQIEAMVAQSADLKVHAIINTKAVSVEIEGISPIKELGPIVDLFHLHKDVTPWIVDCSKGTYLNLHTLKVRYEYDHPEALLNSIYASFDYQGFVYTFQPGLEPIRTRYTDFVFEDGVLNIFPRYATYCGQETKSSWLDIDFNPEDEPVLTAYLQAPFVLNDDIVFLLNYFKIALPFKQLSGHTEADLTLKVPLLSVSVDARGRFNVNQGQFLYKGIDLNISDSAIIIHNSNVDVTQFNAAFEEKLKASAKGYLNFSTGKTDLKFKAEKVFYSKDDITLELDKNAPELLIHYKLSSAEESLSFSPSAWNINNTLIKIDAFKAPFDFQTFSADIPSTEISIKGLLHSYVSGHLDLTNQHYQFDMDIDDLTYKTIRLDQDNLKVSLKQQAHTDLFTDAQSHWLIDQTPLVVAPFHIMPDQSTFSILKGHFLLDDVIQSDMSGSYDLKEKKGLFDLQNFSFDNKKLGDLFAADDTIQINIEEDNNTTHFSIEKLNMYFKIRESGWHLDLYSLEQFSQNSPLLQEYNITKGAFSADSKTGSYPFIFKGHVDYPYSLLIEQERPGSRYTLTGSLNEEETVVQVNEEINVTINDSIHIASDNVGFNLSEIVRFLNEHQNDTDKRDTNDSIALYIDATHTFLTLGSDRRILADNLSIQYKNNHLNAQLHHLQGDAEMELVNNQFQLHGKSFGEKFITHLFKSSQFKGGQFSFLGGGELSAFDGIIKLENTTIRNYILLNNLLAFINTIPALVTFSVPQYSQSGFKVNEAYAALSYHNKVLSIDAIKVDGKEMDIFGDGTLDYNTNTINMELSVKTQAGSNFGKIPLIGYILVGDNETAMTSFTLRGDLDNPEIKNKMAKDIVIAPFNILKRTLQLPFLFLFPNSDDEGIEEDDDTGLKILQEHLESE